MMNECYFENFLGFPNSRKGGKLGWGKFPPKKPCENFCVYFINFVVHNKIIVLFILLDFDYRIGENLYSNKMELTFDEGNAKFIPVGEETKDIICIGNDHDDMMKIQITTKEDTREI